MVKGVILILHCHLNDQLLFFHSSSTMKIISFHLSSLFHLDFIPAMCYLIYKRAILFITNVIRYTLLGEYGFFWPVLAMYFRPLSESALEQNHEALDNFKAQYSNNKVPSRKHTRAVWNNKVPPIISTVSCW